MKSKYNIWKLCFISLACLASLTGCKELSCNFSYSPTTPRSGEVVSFLNESVGADDYLWDFGDNGSSTTSSPTHIYRKPGTYVVTLKIVRNKVEKKFCTHEVVIKDTIPSIAMDSDSIYTYTPVTISADIYNPWKRDVTYRWTLPNYSVVLDGQKMDSSVVVCYFTQPFESGTVQLNLTVGEKNYELSQEIAVYHQKAPSILYRAGQTCYEQFIYTIRKQTLYQDAQVTTLAENIELLNLENDSLYVYKDTLDIAKVGAMIGQDIRGFQMDRLMAKIYAYGDQGLWVRNLLDSNQIQLQSNAISAIKVDGSRNSLYWATSDGLCTHRLLQLRNNKDQIPTEMINTCGNISRISINTTKH